jgi:hypothetical protein
MYVGSGTATEILHEGDEVTVTCCEGAEAMSMADALPLRLMNSVQKQFREPGRR